MRFFLFPAFFALFLLVCAPASMNTAFYDCFVPLQNHEDILLNCYNGILLQTVAKDQLKPLAFSSPPLEVTSFLIMTQAVNRRQYQRYLKDSKNAMPPELQLLNQGEISDAITGIQWQEAENFCRYFAMELPTEMQFESLLKSFSLTIENHKNLKYEWTRDFFQPNPKLNSSHWQSIPTQFHTLRSLADRKERRSSQSDKRNPHIGFRCVSSLIDFKIKENLLDYSQIKPLASNYEKHLLSVHSNPEGADVYMDPDFYHFLGKTPLFIPIEPVNPLVLILKKEGWLDETIHLSPKNGKATHLERLLTKIPEQEIYDPLRKMKMQLVSSSRTKMGISEMDRILVKNKITEKIQNQDLSEEQIRRYLEPEGPDRIVFLPDFYMDSTEITNAQFLLYTKEAFKPSPRCNTKEHGQTHQPVVCITWEEAYEYCRFYKMNLPTEAQWEKAAKGIIQHRRTQWISKAVPVGTREYDRSRYHIFDLAGNVMEWVYDWYDEKAYLNQMLIAPGPTSLIYKEKVIRGGSFDSVRLDDRITKRRHKTPGYQATDLGFRCVKPVKKERFRNEVIIHGSIDDSLQENPESIPLSNP